MKERLWEKLLGAGAISLAAVMWGVDGVILTPRLFNLPVELVVFILHLIPFSLMSIFYPSKYRELLKFSKSDYFYLFLIAISGGALGTIAIVKALFLVNFKSLTVIVLLQKLQPVFAVLMAAMVLKERIRGTYILFGSIAILAGYFLTFGLNLPDIHAGEDTVYASLLALLAAFCFGSSTVFSKKILLKHSFLTATFYRYAFTTIIMVFFVSGSGTWVSTSSITLNNAIIFIIIGLTSGMGAILLYYFGLKKVRAIISAICELFFPLSVIVFDFIVNDTQLDIVQWISVLVMLAAIILLNIENSRVSAKKI